MSEVAENLLASIPQGSEIKDPREGTHEARIVAVEETQYSNGAFALQVTYGDMTDADGRLFEYNARYTYPQSDSPDWLHRNFLDIGKGLGVFPASQKNALHVESEESRAAVLTAFKTCEGDTVSIKLSTDKNGYLRDRILRGKKAA